MRPTLAEYVRNRPMTWAFAFAGEPTKLEEDRPDRGFLPRKCPVNLLAEWTRLPIGPSSLTECTDWRPSRQSCSSRIKCRQSRRVACSPTERSGFRGDDETVRTRAPHVDVREHYIGCTSRRFARGFWCRIYALLQRIDSGNPRDLVLLSSGRRLVLRVGERGLAHLRDHAPRVFGQTATQRRRTGSPAAGTLSSRRSVGSIFAPEASGTQAMRLALP